MWVKKSNTTYNILQCDIVFVGLIEIFLILSISLFQTFVIESGYSVLNHAQYTLPLYLDI